MTTILAPYPKAGLASPPRDVHKIDLDTTTQVIPVPAKGVQESNNPTSTSPQSNHLISSPYLEPAHQLDLASLTNQQLLLAQALTSLSPSTTSYASTPYSTALNWPTVFSTLKHLTSASSHRWTKAIFYVVEFRSKLKPLDEEQNALLFKLDKESHREANQSGGLLKYWYGSTQDDAERRNLATCLWREKEDAVAGGRGPWHKKARDAILQIYESIDVKGLKLTIEDDVSGWKFEPWVG